MIVIVTAFVVVNILVISNILVLLLFRVILVVMANQLPRLRLRIVI